MLFKKLFILPIEKLLRFVVSNQTDSKVTRRQKKARIVFSGSEMISYDKIKDARYKLYVRDENTTSKTLSQIKC